MSTSAGSISMASVSSGRSKSCIVPTSTGYKRLYCDESPGVHFNDMFRVTLTGELTAIAIDQLFLEICEPAQILATATPEDRPVPTSAIVKDGVLYLRTDGPAQTAVVFLRGVRRGFAGVRLTPATKEEFERNSQFWKEANQ
jgi:hypothetical protein